MKKAGTVIMVVLTACFITFTIGFFIGRNMNSSRIQFSDTSGKAETTAPEAVLSTHAEPSDRWKIDINTASAGELDILPGIGPALAERIIAYREEHGAFRNVAELTNVAGIGEKILSQIIEYITVGDAS